ncbi:MAG: hypothetical protein R6U42_00585, partial [Halomonas sp.]
MPDSPGHYPCPRVSKAVLSQKIKKIFRIKFIVGPQDDELARPKSDAIFQAARNAELSILKTGGNFCEKNVALSKIGI